MYASELLEYDQKGNGIILLWQNRFVFTIGKESYWNKATIPWTITFTNIGGNVELGESMIEATKREAFEEIGCEINLLPAPKTLYCILETREYTIYALRDECPPILIYNTPKLSMSVCVYLAQTTTIPVPQHEVPALLLLPPASLHGGPLEQLIQDGGTLQEQVKGTIPRTAILRPWGSAALLATDFDRFNSIAHFSF
ncbi:MAG: NUDIX domain-containing protein [Candidatus Aenigmarchaeota archaeon]|nr:NUDIX domain-containing protein [Candidatus Aenigmarchaeota archaeon]